MKADRMCNY